MLPGRPAKLSDAPSGHVTHVVFGIAGDDLDPAEVMSRTGIAPHLWFRKGDQYIGRNRERVEVLREWPVGRWAVYSNHLVAPGRPEEHLRAILDLVSPVSQIFAEFADEGYVPQLLVTHARYENELGYGIHAADVKRIADLHADLSITCNVLAGTAPEEPAR